MRFLFLILALALPLSGFASGGGSSNATLLQGYGISTAAPADTNCLKYSSSTGLWAPATCGGGTWGSITGNSPQALPTGGITAGNYRVDPSHNTIGNCGSSQTVNLSLAERHLLTLNAANCTLTFTNPQADATYQFELTEDSTGNRGVTWPGTVTWLPGGAVAPLLSGPSKVDTVTCTANATATAYSCSALLADPPSAPSVYLMGTTTGLALSGATWLVSGKAPRALIVENIVGGASVLGTCTTNPTITLYDCGTSTTCASPTTVGSVTITAANTSTDGTVSSSTIVAGDYWLMKITAGSCATTSLWVTAEAVMK